ncbi:hypothetical protein ACFVYD_28365 [Streptomyces sp. NPDC058301]|uniref:hypothetical protein n=1 Tax=Streptomyces sp. NPDC058301 TaxID=3346436 RepID=UPI0036F0BFFA
MVTAHPPLAMTAAVVTVVVLAARWWSTPRKRFSHRIRSLILPSHRPDPSQPADRFNDTTERHPQTLDAGAEVLREAEQLVSRQWDRLQPLYPHHPDDPRSHSR